MEELQNHWLTQHWRPLAAITYLIICLCDFILFPILWSLLMMYHGDAINAWVPLTLQGSGLLHLSFGAILGITAFGRTKEKLQMLSQNSDEK